MKLIKEYNIPEITDCHLCEASILTGQYGQDMYCLGFNIHIGTEDKHERCQACKDWLKRQKRVSDDYKTQLLKECLEMLDRFSYEPSEDSMCDSHFRATLNEDMFFDLKHRIEKYLKQAEVKND